MKPHRRRSFEIRSTPELVAAEGLERLPVQAVSLRSLYGERPQASLCRERNHCRLKVWGRLGAARWCLEPAAALRVALAVSWQEASPAGCLKVFPPCIAPEVPGRVP